MAPDQPDFPESLTFEHLAGQKGFCHGVFTRKGGVSHPPFDGLNVGLGCGDDAEAVRQNRNLLLDSLGLSRAIFLSQVHGDRIHVIHRDRLNPAQLWDRTCESTPSPVEADAVITNVPELGLVIQVADCQAVILYDPVQRVVANVHSGWRGSTLDILGKCVLRMADLFGCTPGNILAGISPSLGPCCAEFTNYKTELPKSFLAYKQVDRPYFNFWQISRDQLTCAGILPDHIRHMELCTVCRTDLFFSYRGEKKTGRFAAVAAVRHREN